MQQSGRKKLVELNPHLTCVLCGGYFVDATTIIECLHSFCKTCIVRYLSLHKICPVCDVQVHKTRPLVNIRSDQTLQDIVYKLVPGLFKNEMRKRREFYARIPPSARGCIPVSSEERGDTRGVERLIFTPEDLFSLSLEYCARDVLPIRHLLGGQTEENPCPPNSRRYLSCPGAFTIGHLKKFLRAKFGLAPNQEVDVMYVHDYLLDEYTLIDLAYIYSWRRNAPMRLLYRFPNLSLPSSAPSHSEESPPVPPDEGKSIVIDTPSTDPPTSASTSTPTSAPTSGLTTDPSPAVTSVESPGKKSPSHDGVVCQASRAPESPRKEPLPRVIPLPPPPSLEARPSPAKLPKSPQNNRRNGFIPNGVRTNFRLILPAKGKGNEAAETVPWLKHGARGSPAVNGRLPPLSHNGTQDLGAAKRAEVIGEGKKDGEEMKGSNGAATTPGQPQEEAATS